MIEINGFHNLRVSPGETIQIGANLVAYRKGAVPGRPVRAVSGSMRLTELVRQYGEVYLKDQDVVVALKTELKEQPEETTVEEIQQESKPKGKRRKDE